MIILGTNSVKDTGFDVANSVRFNGSDEKMTKSSTAGNRTNWTWSGWIKKCSQSKGSSEGFMASWNGENYCYLQFNNSDQLRFLDYTSGNNCNKITNRVFRDTSAWYHIVIAINTNDGTAEDRYKLYVNGVRETSFATSANFSSGVSTNMNVSGHTNSIGVWQTGSTQFYNGYVAEAVLIDGTTLAPTSFGEFDEDSGIWKPIDVSSLTFGNNGYYLDFEDSSNLGNDANGGTDFTEANLAAVNQSISTCTNNFCTINSLDNFYAAATLTEGNLKVTCNAGNTSFITGTFGLTKGKWYWEGKLTTVGGEEAIGITDKVSTATNNYAGQTANSYTFQGNNGNIRNNDGNTSYGSAYGTSVIGVYMDLDNNKLYFAINGTIQNSGTGFNITDPTSTTNGFYFPMVGDVDSDAPVWEVNFGNPVSALSSAVADANGYGSFEYDPSAGTFDSASKDFLAICTKNLAEYG